MKLQKAITVTAKFCAKDKGAPEVYKAIRFFPAKPDLVARLCATDGQVTNIAYLDDGIDVPNALITKAFLTQLAKNVQTIDAVFDMGYGKIKFVVTGKTETRGQAIEETLPPSDFPEIAPLPEIWEKVDWPQIRRVVHTVSDNTLKPYLGCVNFRAECVEATDEYRVGRANIHGNWSGLVPSEAFQASPSIGYASVAFTHTKAYFRLGDQLRIAKKYDTSQYPDLGNMIPREHWGSAVVVNPETLAEIVKKGTDLSPVKRVVLEFGLLAITVRSYGDGPQKGWFAKVDCRQDLRSVGCFIAEKMIISGKFLHEALKSLTTPKVRLCYGVGPKVPLRIESGSYIECIWQGGREPGDPEL